MAKKKKQFKPKTEAALRKKYSSNKASNIVVASEDMLWIPSRFLAINELTGGGVPYGKILEIFGEESSGKSLLAMDFAYSTIALGGMVLWADAEYAFTEAWALQNGIDLDKVELFREKSIERISDWTVDMGMYYRSKLVNNEPILLVVDSTAATDCEANRGTEQLDRKAEMGNRAKAIDTMLRGRNDIWEELGITAIFINQLRKKIGASQFEDPDTTPGGAAMKFYASIRLGVYGGKQIKGKVNGYEDRVGRVTSIRVKKNKVAPPKPTIKSAPVYFHPEYKEGVGFDKYFSLTEILERKGVITRKKGASRYYLKDKMLANGEEALVKLLRKDDKLRSKLIRRAKINSISKTRKKIESINGNLYPIET